MEERDIVFIVGDVFEVFAAHWGAMTAGQLITALTNEDIPSLCNKKFILGQGVQKEQQDLLLTLFEQKELPQRSNSHLVLPPFQKAGDQQTHKHHPKNIMISQPRAIDESVYEATLLIDGRNDLLGDHITGQHIQGLALIEAARQIAFVVTDTFFLTPAGYAPAYFVLHELNTTFHSFTFPLDVTLRYTILEKQLDNPSKLFFSVLITVIQADRCVTEIRSTFTVCESRRLAATEDTLARRVLQQHIRSLQNEASQNSEQHPEKASVPMLAQPHQDAY